MPAVAQLFVKGSKDRTRASFGGMGMQLGRSRQNPGQQIPGLHGLGENPVPCFALDLDLAGDMDLATEIA